MKLLITGAHGFVGRRLAWHIPLAEVGVTLLIRSVSPKPLSVDTSAIGWNWVYHDLRAPFPPRLLDRLTKTDVIVHAAAEVSGARSIENPVRTVESNVLGTFHMLEAARALGVKQFVYLSTTEVLGHAEAPDAVGEDAPLRPSSPYSASKAAGEELCRVWARAYGVPMCIVRLANVFGPGQQEPRFVPATVRKILRGEPVVCHYRASDGVIGSRNWMPIEDCVRVLWRLVQERKIGTYHVVGPELTNENVIRALGHAIGKDFCLVVTEASSTHELRYAARDTKLGIQDRLNQAYVLEKLALTAKGESNG